MKMLACWRRMDLCAALQYCRLIWVLSARTTEAVLYLPGMEGFNTGIRAFTTLGRAGGAVPRKPFSVSVSLIQGTCLEAL